VSTIVNQNLPQTPKSPPPRPVWTPWDSAIWLAVVAGIAIRFLRLGRQSLWFDEGYTAWVIRHSPSELLRLIRADTAPPLFYFLLHGWTGHYGYAEASLRSLSAVFSSITLILAVWIARRILVSPPAVAATAWLLAIGFHQPYYAQEARCYALLAVLYVAAIGCLMKHLGSQKRGWLVPIALLLTAAMYTHNIILPYLPAFFLAWLIFPSEHSLRRRVADSALTLLSMALLYSPWAIFALPAQMHMVDRGFWIPPLTLRTTLTVFVWIFDIPPYFYWNHTFSRLHIPLRVENTPIVLGILLVAASGLIVLVRLRGPRLRNALALAVLVFLPFILICAYSFLRKPILMDKTFLPAAALAPLLLLFPLSVDLPRFWRRCVVAGAILVSLISLSTLVAYETVQKKENWRGAARFVQDLPATPRLIVFAANDGQLPFDYYYRYSPDDQITGVPSGFFDRNPPQTMMRVQSDQDLGDLRDRLASNSYGEIILVLSHADWSDPRGLTEHLLSQGYQETQRKIIDSEITIIRFAPANSGPRYAQTPGDSHQFTSTAVASSDRFSVPAN
jgi:mannosyltransferase